MKKNDIIIISLSLILAIIVYIGLMVNKGLSDTDNLSVEVHMDGEVLEIIPLSFDGGVYYYEHIYGHNEVTIDNNTVHMSHADCPDLSCTRQKPIELPNENIVCLPYRFHIVVVGDGGEVLIDAISK